MSILELSESLSAMFVSESFVSPVESDASTLFESSSSVESFSILELSEPFSVMLVSESFVSPVESDEPPSTSLLVPSTSLLSDSSSELNSFKSEAFSFESSSISELNSFRIHVAFSPSLSSWPFFKVTLNSEIPAIEPEGLTSKSKVSLPEASQWTFELFVISWVDIASTKIAKTSSRINFLFILNKNK